MRLHIHAGMLRTISMTALKVLDSGRSVLHNLRLWMLQPCWAERCTLVFAFARRLCCAVCVVLRCALLRCAVLRCAVLCYAVLCYAVLCYAVLCCAVLCCAVLCCAVLCCAVLCCAADMLCTAVTCLHECRCCRLLVLLCRHQT